MGDGSSVVAERWYSAIELKGLPGLPGSERRVRSRAEKEGWQSRSRAVGKGLEYAFASLPPTAQAALLLRDGPRIERTSKRQLSAERIRSAWEAYNGASESRKATAQQRFAALHAVEGLCAQGAPLMDARRDVAQAMQRDGIKGGSVPSLGRWAKLVESVDRGDWLALLLPCYIGNTSEVAIPPDAWDFYRGHYLGRGRPSYQSTYRRVVEMAEANGWEIPSAMTFRRRLIDAVPEYTRKLYRDGPTAAAALLPRGRRDELVFSAGEAVNGDGLKFDKFFTRFDDGEVLNTATAWFWQDLRTRKILAWRLAKTENTDLFRLATYDLTGVCAPKYAWMDNTRVAANKTMTAGAAGRRRHKDGPEDGLGLLLMLGMEPHFTNPDKETGTPGAKPIERAFGIGGIHSEVATHPRIVALGNANKANAVPEALLREIIAIEVERHNARPKRETQACRGVLSFNEAWEESVAEQPVRVLSQVQRNLLLLQREVVRADKRTGLLLIKGGRWAHGQNGFWDKAMTEYLGRQVVVHYDPDNIRAGAHVYSLDGRYLMAVEHQAHGQPFNSTEAGREINKLRARDIKHFKGIASNEVLRSKKERAAMYDQVERAPPTTPLPATNVVEGVFQRTVNPERDAQRLERTGTDNGPSTLDDLMTRIRPMKGDGI